MARIILWGYLASVGVISVSPTIGVCDHAGAVGKGEHHG